MIPKPPENLINAFVEDFLPAPEIGEFVKNTFLNETSELFNESHTHLLQAEIGYLWTNAENVRQMRFVAATAEIPKPPMQSSAWTKARYNHQLRQWFGTDKLDFLLTFDARYMNDCEDINFLSTIDHELYHCAQKRDEFGGLRFNDETGKPIYGLLGHDVEEFVGIVRRYGASAGAGQTKELVEAAASAPLIGAADIKRVCGNCR